MIVNDKTSYWSVSKKRGCILRHISNWTHQNYNCRVFLKVTSAAFERSRSSLLITETVKMSQRMTFDPCLTSSCSLPPRPHSAPSPFPPHPQAGPPKTSTNWTILSTTQQTHSRYVLHSLLKMSTVKCSSSWGDLLGFTWKVYKSEHCSSIIVKVAFLCMEKYWMSF